MKSTKPNTITDQQRRLYFAILRDIRESGRDLIVSLNGKIVPMPIYTLSTENAKELLKMLDLNYPKTKGKPESMARGQISTKDMNDHIRWLETTAIESNMTIGHYQAEMERLSNFSQIETKFDAD